MDISWPSGTADTIEKIINADGRPVTFYYETSVSGCGSCGLNPITNRPIDPFCEVCSGIYWIPTYSGITKTCHVTWKDSDDLRWATGGQYFVGDCKIKFIYSAENYMLASDATHITVDDKVLTKNKITLLGVPTINRIIVHAEEKEKDDE